MGPAVRRVDLQRAADAHLTLGARLSPAALRHPVRGAGVPLAVSPSASSTLSHPVIVACRRLLRRRWCCCRPPRSSRGWPGRDRRDWAGDDGTGLRDASRDGLCPCHARRGALLDDAAPSPSTRRLPATGATPVHLLAVAALGAPNLVFCLLHAVSDPSPLAWILVAGVVFATIAAFLVGFTVADEPAGTVALVTMAVWSMAWACRPCLGTALSNNLLNGLIADHLRAPRRRSARLSPPLASRNLFGDDVAPGLSFLKFAGEECRDTGSCSTASYFLADWGFLAVVALATWMP
jgi:hypothetical protein